MTQEEFDKTEFKPGMRVRHRAFGDGTVVQSDMIYHVSVVFDDGLGPFPVRFESVEPIKGDYLNGQP